MANHLYGYNNSSSYGGGGGGGGGGGSTTTMYTSSSRSMADTYPYSIDSSRYLTIDPFASSDGGYSRAATTTAHLSLQASSWPGPPGVDVGSAAAADPYLASGMKRSSAEALYYQNIYSAHNPIGQTEAWYSTNPLVKRPRYESASHLPIYPQRPGEKDCAHYMQTRTCRFGDTCKFDHPIWVPEGGIPDWKEVPLSTTTEMLPERPGEPDCPYFVKTQRCKFGVRCRFNHPKDSIAHSGVIGDTDVSALPERPSEPPCAFYMKTGKCKFGPTCKFHHPKDIHIPAAGLETGSTGNTVSGGDENPANLLITPATMHNSKGLPVRLGEIDCPFYLKTGSCKYGATCRYNHPDRNIIIPPAAAITSAFVASPVTHLNIGVVNPAASILQSFDPRLTQTQLGVAMTIYPQRPGQLECDFYMKTGECKFGDKCKFHHPVDRSVNMVSAMEAQQQQVKLSLAGLPRREGAIHCPYYMKTGMCKYGATCKFDHPPPGEVMAMATSQGTTVPGEVEAKEDEKVAETVQS